MLFFFFLPSLPCGMRSLFLWGQQKEKREKLLNALGDSNERSEWAVN
jgi:hypothetical protein